MHESERDSQWKNEPEAQNHTTGPTQPGEPEAMSMEMAHLVLLQRIYDVQLAILNEMNSDRADEIFEEHERGRNFNPPIWWDISGEIEDMEQ